MYVYKLLKCQNKTIKMSTMNECTCIHKNPNKCEKLGRHDCTCATDNWNKCKSIQHQCVCLILDLNCNGYNYDISPVCKAKFNHVHLLSGGVNL